MRSNKLALLVIVGCLAAGCRSRSRCVESDANRRALQAAWANDVRAMRDLLARDASIATAPGCTRGGGPIHLAASMGHADLVRLMIEQGTSVDAVADDDYTPLRAAIVGGHNDVVAMLIAKGADVNRRGNQDTTPLILAVEMGDADTVRLLVERGADVNARSARGESPLTAAARSERHDLAALLVARGAAFKAEGDCAAGVPQGSCGESSRTATSGSRR